MTLAWHVFRQALASPTAILSCLAVWLLAFGIPPTMPEDVGAGLSLSSQVICVTYFLIVIVTSLALHSALGPRCRALKLLLHTPASPLRVLAECLGAVVGVAAILAVASIAASQVVPWYRTQPGSSLLPGLLCFLVCGSWLALSTLAMHIWLEPELCLPLALALLLGVMYRPGAVPFLPDLWCPEAALAGELDLARFAVRAPLLLFLPVGVAAAGIRSGG
jgi:hypothetical protein